MSFWMFLPEENPFLLQQQIYKSTLLLALKPDFKDFEDAVQYAAAKQVNADFIITRNIKDFRKSDIPIASPDSFLATLKLAD